MAKKKQHGGKRKGAGRKPAHPEGKTVTIAASVPGPLVDQLNAHADHHGLSRSEALTHAIRAFLDARKRGVRH